MGTDLFDTVRIIDTDTHVVEPYDLWTSRLSTKKWGDMVPHVQWVDEEQRDVWFFGTTPLVAAASSAMAGWPEFPPNQPQHLEDAAPETYDPVLRLKRMDQDGIYAQVLYPNVQGFGTGRFLALDDPELMLQCVQAYNDFLVDWSSTDPNRYIPIAALPFWDLDATVTEMKRAVDIGHRGITFSTAPEFYGSPHLTDPYWDTIWAAAQDLELSVNFHIGSGDRSDKDGPVDSMGASAKFASSTVKFFMGNVKGVADIIHGGICHRFPDLKFVSVESGVGWIPYALEAMDWNWRNAGVMQEHPEYELLPSEYFRRQMYGCFWHETTTMRFALETLGPDCILYETDFPHPTSMSPGPCSYAQAPLDFLRSNFSDLPAETLNKILHDNAAKLYKVK
jgi:predicted TIM-barrel fold metal-dependent hydrolase